MKFRVSANGIGIIGQFHFVLVPFYHGLCPCRLGSGRGWVGIRSSSYLHVFHFECTQIHILFKEGIYNHCQINFKFSLILPSKLSLT